MSDAEFDQLGESHMVAAAVVSVIPGSSTLFTAQIVAGLVEEQFREDGVELVGCGSFFGLCFVVVVLTVKETKPALQSLYRAIEAHKPLNHYPREIAYFDRDELIWRTAFPAQPLAPFERFLTPAIIAASQAHLQADMSFIRNVIQHQSQL